MHGILDFCPRLARKEMNVPIHKRSYELTVLIYTMARLTMISIVLFTGTSCRGISSATRAKISA